MENALPSALSDFSRSPAFAKSSSISSAGSSMPQVTTLAAFIEQVKKLTARQDRGYAYRGEANIEWKLFAGIMRDGHERLWENERKATRDLISVHPSEFKDDETMFDRLVRMQHFGLPTRLLDVSANPLVALFNATESSFDSSGSPKNGRVYRISIPWEYHKYYDSDTVSCVSNLANLSAEECQELYDNHNLSIDDFNDINICGKAVDRLAQFIRAEKPSFRPQINGRELTEAWYVIPKLSNRRIIAQSGAFLIFGLCRDPMRYLSSVGIAYQEIIIPESAKKDLRAELSTLGITESALFPEIDKAAKLVRERYKK